MIIHVTTRSEYDYIVSRGYEPLLEWRYFTMDIKLRIEIQKEIFGEGCFVTENQRYYKWCWDHKLQYCEETAQPLYDYSAKYVSHIISKGADRRMATDPRNVNLLIPQMHSKWEFGKDNIKRTMNIYKMNRYIIEILKSDYNKLR